MDIHESVTIHFVVKPNIALALAQFVKRVGFNDIRDNAIDDPEAYQMLDGILRLQKALGHAGYSPQ